MPLSAGIVDRRDLFRTLRNEQEVRWYRDRWGEGGGRATVKSAKTVPKYQIEMFLTTVLFFFFFLPVYNNYLSSSDGRAHGRWCADVFREPNLMACFKGGLCSADFWRFTDESSGFGRQRGGGRFRDKN